MRRSLVYSGALAQVPRQGGLTWLHLQFLLGFRRLGWDVLFLDRLWPEVCGDQPNTSLNLRYLRGVLGRYGFGDDYAVLDPGGASLDGLTRSDVLARAAEADLLLNVMGYLGDTEILGSIRRRAFLDIDPGFPQMWRDLGLHDAFAGHTDFVTLGRNIGRQGCIIPTCGLKWVTMPQPVVLDEWPAQPPRPGGAWTSIGAWRGPNGPVEYGGRIYGLRVHAFRPVIELPRLCPGERFELALDIHLNDAKDVAALRGNGWSLVEPTAVAGGPEEYREYVAASKAEFMVPKAMYVETNSGLLSDRSVYYLATGRPVLARDTGLARLYPTGNGIATFTTLEEARAGVERLDADYARHAAAARRLAETYFDSDVVLTKLLDDLNISGPRRFANA